MSVYSAKILRYAFRMISTVLSVLLAFTPNPNPQFVIRGCAPPATMCDTLAAVCDLAGLPDERCDAFAAVCDLGDKCGACERTHDTCVNEKLGACDQIQKFCSAAIAGCGCNKADDCVAAGSFEPDDLVSLCLLYPSPLLDDCGAPSAGQCMAMMNWEGCGITTCDYVMCVEHIENLECSTNMPEICDEVAKCAVEA